MAPATMSTYQGNTIFETEEDKLGIKIMESASTPGVSPVQIVWRNVIFFLMLHTAALAGVMAILTGRAMWQTIILTYVLYVFGGIGVTGGAHRYWTHRSYKARTPLQLLLAVMFTMAFQNSIWEWVRDHRLHHKYSETDADPHNSRRGFFFSHMGWLLVRKHPMVRQKSKIIDLSDLEADKIVMFQKRYHLLLGLFIGFIGPALIPYYLWNESLLIGFLLCGTLRYVITLHFTWFVNSAAHMWGMKPYDKTIQPSENRFVAVVALGEGWHNYHHVFPWDYKTAELGGYKYNFTTAFIDFFARTGLAYDLKTASTSIVQDRKRRTAGGGPTG